MKSKKYPKNRKLINGEKRLEKKHYSILIGLMVFGAGYYYFNESKTIGHDIRYSIYIFWLPTIIGIVTLAIYRRKFLITKFSTNKGVVLWTFMIFFYLLQGFIFSYLSFGQIAKISWDILNERAIQQNQIVTLRCDVTRFWTKRRPYSIDFKFNGKRESIIADYQTLKEYINENPKDYEIEIELNKGIWNYYKLNSWTLSKK